tara:strand:- start:157 stop:435 length:279 start_codon:yes stop_codon:yes gene_type:complete
MNNRIDKILDNLCNNEINKAEASKELSNLLGDSPNFRIGDDVLIDNNYRTTVIMVDEESVTVFDYQKESTLKVPHDRVCLTMSYYEKENIVT